MKLDISEWKEDFPEAEDLTVEIKKLTFGEYSDLQDEIANVKMVGNQQIVNASVGKAKILMLVKGIKKAPFPITIEGIRNIPCDLGDYLFDKIDELNSAEKN